MENASVKSLWKKTMLPRALQGATEASVEMSFMERGSFRSQFSKDSFSKTSSVSQTNEIHSDEFDQEDETRARMM